MSVLESYIERQVVKAAEASGFMQRKIVYQNRAGSPDRWFFGPGGRLIIVEFKRPGEVPEPHQEREIARLRNLGFEVHVIDNIADGRALFL